MKIIQLSDPHLMAPGGLLYGSDPLARLDACLADIGENHADADLVVISGDLTNDGERAAYAALRERLAQFSPACRLMLGNHDDRAVFLEMFPHAAEQGFVQSVFDGSEGRLILLDTLDSGQVEGRLCAARLGWLDERLQEAHDRPVFLFMHHPPFRIHMPVLDAVKLADADTFHDLLARHGNVRHIFAGHVHRLIAGSWRGIPVSTLRSTNHQTALDFSDSWSLGHESPAYAVIFIDADGVIVHFRELPIVG
ncbi:MULTISPECIES: phosphodiesterase [unclassified Mesorhizobium]|uniref:phosphodiesterase n=1 Tax=unclassified Mesorhizobium TaxID=325217 RepID=UPI00112906D9|nr:MULTISPECIES: phosphodiesterase [unclassified Mesorhizobium]TPK85242.1 phosphodiesterase [Mesorhizobium sp. B2-4-17]TPK94871.1 phosphodiesterase [Mesorhizobium sp. B2-4-14]